MTGHVPVSKLSYMLNSTYTNTLADLALAVAQQERHWRRRDYQRQAEALREVSRLTRELDLEELTAEHIQLALVHAAAGTRGVDTPDAPKGQMPYSRKDVREFVARPYDHAISDV